jgi:hypothetical protein
MLVEQLALFAQRWHRRRTSYRPAGEPFDPSRYAVEPIEEREAKAYVLLQHYAGSYPVARYRAGLFHKPPFGAARLVGVGVFSVPMNQQVIPCYFPGLPAAAGVELGRFVLDESVPGNGESWTLARMRRLMRGALPEVRAEIAYCDPVERRDETGAFVKRGHVGTIYKASNAVYRGTPVRAGSGSRPMARPSRTGCCRSCGRGRSASAMRCSGCGSAARPDASAASRARRTSAGCRTTAGCSRCGIPATMCSPREIRSDRAGRAGCSLHPRTPCSRSRPARTVCAGGLAAVFEP